MGEGHELREILPVQAERKLWLSVIERAVQEAEGSYLFGGKGETSPKMLQYLARKWLTRGTKSFRLACSYAGFKEVEVEKILEIYRSRYGNVGRCS